MSLGKIWTILLIPFVLFCSIFAVYSSTLCPTVSWEDATVAHVLGIAHPPGHPLYTIIGHLFTLLPLGSIAWRVNFMSAFFGAVASALVYPAAIHLTEEKNGSRFPATGAAVAARTIKKGNSSLSRTLGKLLFYGSSRSDPREQGKRERAFENRH